MYLRGKPKYENYGELWSKGYASPYFQATYDKETEQVDLSLSERQLLVQSNGRTMLGQDTKGRLHFACTPHDHVYAVPSGSPDAGGQFHGHIGQYYQTDVALLLGKMRYELELDSGLLLDAVGEEGTSYYLDHFLPVTERKRSNLLTRVFSLAPIPEEESAPVSDLHPLPGPTGAVFGLYLENTGAAPLRGMLHLRLNQLLANQFEHYGKRFEDYCHKPYRAEWDNKLLVLWHPEGCATVQLLGAQTGGDADNPNISIPFELEAGEQRVFTTILSITPKREDAYAALGVLYRHDALEWINLTAAYWNRRFGAMEIQIRENPEDGGRYRDMHIRFVLDNFNCLQFNETGKMLTNWQGAPSHCLGRTWGIDMEPNIFGVLNVVPEIGRAAIEYTLAHNLPQYSVYSDHSMMIALAPLTIAGRYLELTGDGEYFRTHPEIVAGLKAVYQYMLRHKHQERALFSSRYASDLIVFKKYDYGTNAKCFYALRLYAGILEALGENAEEVHALAGKVREALRELMEGEGPFGRQITGGSNMGEDTGRFYVEDDMMYYGGEDSATSLAPVYGLYGFDYEPYVNLNRYARSLFIPNYDLEFQTLRELHYGANPSATAAILRLGGSLTRTEMEKSLGILFERLDDTGSLFWWPRATNKKRCLTRCSQGQGAWLQHSYDQWLGLRMDGPARMLTICPQGLLTSYRLEKTRVGSFVFDVAWEETETESRLQVKNHNAVPITIRFGIRAFGAGAEGDIQYIEQHLAAGETIELSGAQSGFGHGDSHLIGRKEAELLAEEGVVFGPYGIVLPKLCTGDCDVFLLRFAIVNAETAAWENADVELVVPEGWRAAPKGYYKWEYDPVFTDNRAVIALGKAEPLKHYSAGFFVLLPRRHRGNHDSVMLSRYPFQYAGDAKEPLKLLVESTAAEDCGEITARLRYQTGERELRISVCVLDKLAYHQEFDKMLHG